MKNKISLIILSILYSNYAYNQCAMCKAVLESSENTGMAEGINSGIEFLALMPYLIVSFMIFFVYKKYHK
tara:strand:- start:17417 stop:17626 length:210 start_codon:yes stop_codon:yes gene_type:complete